MEVRTEMWLPDLLLLLCWLQQNTHIMHTHTPKRVQDVYYINIHNIQIFVYVFAHVLCI